MEPNRAPRLAPSVLSPAVEPDGPKDHQMWLAAVGPPRLPLGNLQPHLNLSRCSPPSEFCETAPRGVLSLLVPLLGLTLDKTSQS